MRPKGGALAHKQLRMQQIVDYIDQGLSQVEIAKKLGVTQGAVSKMARKALTIYPSKTVDMHRELMLMELAEVKDRVFDVLRADHPYVSEGRTVYPIVGHDPESGRPIYGDTPLQDAAPVLKAAQTIVTVLKRISEQIGGDAPKRVESTSVHLGAKDLPVMKLIGDLERANGSTKHSIVKRVEAQRALPPGQVGAPIPHGAREHRLRFGSAYERVAEDV